VAGCEETRGTRDRELRQSIKLEGGKKLKIAGVLPNGRWLSHVRSGPTDRLPIAGGGG